MQTLSYHKKKHTLKIMASKDFDKGFDLWKMKTAPMYKNNCICLKRSCWGTSGFVYNWSRASFCVSRQTQTFHCYL